MPPANAALGNVTIREPSALVVAVMSATGYNCEHRGRGAPLGSPEAALNMITVTSVPTICGEDTINLGDEVWVNNLAPMAGRFGPVDCMPGVVVGFLRDGKDWLVSVKQKGTLALPITGEAWIHHADVRQITLR